MVAQTVGQFILTAKNPSVPSINGKKHQSRLPKAGTMSGRNFEISQRLFWH
jgi:hypothetical protein